MKKIIQDFDHLLEKLSRWGLISSLFIILGMSILSIVLRWMQLTPSWIEPMIRHLVFLSTFLGGSLATSKDVHIKVDILTHFVKKSSSRMLFWFHKNLVTFFCFLTTVGLTKASWDFYFVEKEFGHASFLNIHSSFLVAIIPFGMGLISLRFFNRLLIGLIQGDSREYNRL